MGARSLCFSLSPALRRYSLAVVPTLLAEYCGRDGFATRNRGPRFRLIRLGAVGAVSYRKAQQAEGPAARASNISLQEFAQQPWHLRRDPRIGKSSAYGDGKVLHPSFEGLLEAYRRTSADESDLSGYRWCVE